MFSSTILDAAAGVLFGFLAVSLFTSAAVEVINSFFKLRSRSLVSGIKALMNDPNFTGLARSLYQHAAINPRGPGVSAPLRNSPAYIDATQFAGALLDVSGLAAGGAPTPGPAGVDELKKRMTTTDPQISQLLGGMVDRCNGDLAGVRKEVAAWFDTGMDRVSGAFKRWTQLATFVIALVMAVIINIDSVRVATVLWEQPMLADQIKLSPAQAASRDQAIADLASTLQARLPVGWAPGHFMEQIDEHGAWRTLLDRDRLPLSILGWLITAVSALFGAPFWFDTLQTVVRLKGSGNGPK